MDRAKTNPRTLEERLEALRLGIENAIGLIEHVDGGAACVELRARLRTDEEVAERAGPGAAGGVSPRRDVKSRPYQLPDGKVTYVVLHDCECSAEERRGPAGGCCGKCGGAIPAKDGT
jgi:hypothetical protein